MSQDFKLALDFFFAETLKLKGAKLDKTKTGQKMSNQKLVERSRLQKKLISFEEKFFCRMPD